MKTASQNSTAIEVNHLTKAYQSKAGTFTVLNDVSFQVTLGEFVAVMGKSGSGKSTLLNMITGIDRPSSGEIRVTGTSVNSLNESQTAVWRGATIGIVFQFFQLLPTLTVLENVALPMDFCKVIPRQKRVRRSRELLERVGLTPHADKLPDALSGGEQQRVAIARALANDPSILIADEPTGNLDHGTSESIFSLFSQLSAEGKTVVMVTHEPSVTQRGYRVITLADGKLVNDTANGSEIKTGVSLC